MHNQKYKLTLNQLEKSSSPSSPCLGKQSHCECGWPKRDCFKCPTLTKEQSLVKELKNKELIDEYNNGWIRKGSDWYPLSFYLKKFTEGK
jgi:hypothetical protein